MNETPYLSQNTSPFVIQWLMQPKNQHHIYWNYLIKNPSCVPALPLIMAHIQSIDSSAGMANARLTYFCGNPNPNVLRQIKMRYPHIYERINVVHLYNLKNPACIDIIDKHIANAKKTRDINENEWMYLVQNPAAMHLIEPYARAAGLGFASRRYLALNPNPQAIRLLQSLTTEMPWGCICANTTALRVMGVTLVEVFKKLSPELQRAYTTNSISRLVFVSADNPSLFEIKGYKYAAIEESRRALHAELFVVVLQPRAGGPYG